MWSMNRARLFPTSWAVAALGAVVMARAPSVSASVPILVVMACFPGGEEVDAVLALVGREHPVTDRDRAAGLAVPQDDRRGTAGFEAPARMLTIDKTAWGEEVYKYVV